MVKYCIHDWLPKRIGAILLVVALAFFTNPIHGQNNTGKGLLEQARTQMDKGNYEAANITFRRMLKEVNTLPPEMCYYFAETLYILEQYENSKNFVDKFLELTDKSHNLFEEANELQGLLSGKHREIRSCNYCNAFGYRLQTCTTCQGSGKIKEKCEYCRGKGIISCQLCEGKGVTITQSKVDNKIYNSCTRCHGKGYHECPNCHGNKVLKQRCPVCLGSGEEASDIICDHTPPDHQHP